MGRAAQEPLEHTGPPQEEVLLLPLVLEALFWDHQMKLLIPYSILAAGQMPMESSQAGHEGLSFLPPGFPTDSQHSVFRISYPIQYLISYYCLASGY